MKKFLESLENPSQDKILCSMVKFQTDRLLHKQEFNIDVATLNIVEELLEARGIKDADDRVLSTTILDAIKSLEGYVKLFEPEKYCKPTDYDTVDAFCDIAEFATGDILKIGYNPLACLREMSSEINSRIGIIVDGKFQKDKSIEARSNWYIADFSKAKLENDIEN